MTGKRRIGSSKSWFAGPSWAPPGAPKKKENRIKIEKIRFERVYFFCIDVWMDFGPKSIQNEVRNASEKRPKKEAKRELLERVKSRETLVLSSKIKVPGRSENHFSDRRTRRKQVQNEEWILGPSLDRFWMDLGGIWGPFSEALATFGRNFGRWKRDPKKEEKTELRQHAEARRSTRAIGLGLP